MKKIQSGNESLSIAAILAYPSVQAALAPLLPIIKKIIIGIAIVVGAAIVKFIQETISEKLDEKAKKELNAQLTLIIAKYKDIIAKSFNSYKQLLETSPNKINSLRSKYPFLSKIREVEELTPESFSKDWAKCLIDVIKKNKLKKQTSNIDYEFKAVICAVDIDVHQDFEEEQELAMYKEIESLLSTDNIKVECDYNGDNFFYIVANISINIKQEDINKIISLINQARIRDNKVAQESLYKEALKYHNEILNYNFNVANESLVTAMSRFIRNLLNVIFKIMNNFRAMTIKGFRDLKRTELEAYTDSIKFTVNRILDFSYTTLYNLDVDIPLGMIKPYKVTTTKIKDCLDSMNMLTRLNGVTTSVNSLITSLMTGTNSVIKQNSINLGELKSLEHLYKEEHNCFSSSYRKEKEKFSKVFESDHCFRDTYELLKKVVVNEYDVSKVYSTLEQLYSKFETILKMLENKEVSLTKTDLIQLSGQTTSLAKLFDMYGILIEDLQRVEHNFVCIMKEIHSTYNL